MTWIPHDVAKGLRENGIDSIRHAMGHFSERGHGSSDTSHHDKWIVLSVYHAAECICNALLLSVDSNSPLFRHGTSEWFPSLRESIESLNSAANRPHLTPAEERLLKLLAQLPDLRHSFMHRLMPTKIDVSIAAMSLMGMLKHLEARHGTDSSDIVWQSPPIETDIVEAIRYQRLEEYGRFIEAFLAEKYKGKRLGPCPSCGVMAVRHRTCEACFQELDAVTCPACDEDVLFLPWERETGRKVVECECGATINI